ncbi:capsular polysaccharide biosynthesis protein [Listeria fleischmannii 1991]|uniref:Capsular polysaccharide type 8 biosynthesis protein cap8A n=2 Tax=Listeria fleischmannii TaxID=1069827 RepID=A0A2X3HCV9_9LIST|nr:Wzz/FepE/Etk N-terminal domain-containing protein [Listeria fleischmannii]EMG26694.1 capsular polysaccharide synthesis enzyme CapA [Listeria fleischmannii subsp. fleischmannii LU2006-1]KMT61441.1 capsular polysaccharide biosynthesis protein [Listeria fleischmannii 1991]SQC70397.1 Capsular polysaccharide type 8 biosynthesis protein cap8A [Listeria fleischmannii subsp. fleischmannii]
MTQAQNMNQFLRSIKKMWYWFIIIPLVLVALTFLITHFVMKPTYTTSTQLLVTPPSTENASQTSDNVRSSIQLADTYSTTITSARTLQEVIKQNKLDISAAELANKLTIKSNTNSLVYTVNVRDSDPEMAQKIADGVGEATKKDFPKLFNGTKVVVLEKADTAYVVTNLMKYILSIGLGFGLAMVIILIQMSYDNVIRQKENLMNMDITFLGDIPYIEGIDK